jgi:excisionase family DNA binding protein
MMAPVATNDELLTLPSAARELGISHVTLYRLVKAGRIPSTRVGAYHLIRRTDLEAFRRLDRKAGRPKSDQPPGQ